MKKLAVALLTITAACALWAESTWSNVDDEHYVAGPRLTPDKLKGRIVFVERWGIHCGPCLASLPHLQKLYSKYNKKGVVFIAAHCQEFDKDGILAAIKKAGVEFSVYQGAGLPDAPKAGGIPAPYLVGADGKVAWNSTGFNAANAENAIQQAIKAAPNLEHDILLADIRSNLKERPGLALLQLEQFEKTYSRERASIADERKELATPRARQLKALERDLVKLQNMATPNPLLKQKRAADAAKLLRKAKTLECPALVEELEKLAKSDGESAKK